MGCAWFGSQWGPGGLWLGAALGWLAAAGLDTSTFPPGLRRRLSGPGGRWLAVWVRLTDPLVRISRPLRRLRSDPAAPPEGRGLLSAETRATLTPEGGRLDREERVLLRRLLASEAILVSDIMTRWDQVDTLPADASPGAACRAFQASGHSRLPLVSGDAVVGMITVKNLLAANEDAAGDVRAMMHPVYFVRYDTVVQGVFDEMREARVHLAVVVNRLGRPVGVVTIEDMLEEIVGELYDEREAPGGTA